MKLKDLIPEYFLTEIEWKKVIRKGKKVRKAVCPDNKKYDANKKKCVTVKATEKQKKVKGAKKAAKKRSMKQAKINKKRAKSMKKRMKQIGR